MKFKNAVIFLSETTTTAVHEYAETNSPKLELSDQKPFFIFFSASVIIFICIFVGVLCWLFRTYPRKPGNVIFLHCFESNFL